jgi:hypothetical protein
MVFDIEDFSFDELPSFPAMRGLITIFRRSDFGNVQARFRFLAQVFGRPCSA